MNNVIHPGFIFILGALALPLFRRREIKQALQLFVPVFAFTQLLLMEEGTYWVYKFISYDLILGRVDKLSMCFAYVFVMIAFLGMIYALHVKEDGQHVATFLYVGGTLGVTFAGDLFTLFAFWELMAIYSVFIIWYQKSQKALNAGFRYLMVHLVGGGSLLAGIIMHASQTGSIQFTTIGYGGLASHLILVGFLVNAAVPPFSAWLSDAYPEASVTGSVFLSAFTTKAAVYVLLRGYPGVELLTWMGAIMALYGVVYAVLENDIRRLLAYHIISQVGFMVCGVGLGSEMSLNGSTAHAFCHILYKALLFMGAGAVIEVTGKSKITELQGRNLYRAMPICFSLYMVGAFSISAVPLFNGFISKNMILFAAGEMHRTVVHLLLHLASIGTFLSLSLKLPYGTWFGKAPANRTLDVIPAKEPPLNMLIGMAMTAFVCIFTGIYPKALYDILPYHATFMPYTIYSVSTMLQLLIFAALAFFLFIDKMRGAPTISIDTDWFYRKGALGFMAFSHVFDNARIALQGKTADIVESLVGFSKNPIRVFEMVVLHKKSSVLQYDANTYRQAIGIGVMLSLILLSLFCIIFFVYLFSH